jgi:hypothetical protein
MSIIQGLWKSKGGKLYLLILLLVAGSFFFFGYFIAKNEATPIVIEKSGN